MCATRSVTFEMRRSMAAICSLKRLSTAVISAVSLRVQGCRWVRGQLARQQGLWFIKFINIYGYIIQ